MNWVCCFVFSHKKRCFLFHVALVYHAFCHEDHCFLPALLRLANDRKYQPAEFRRLSVRDIIAVRCLLSAFGLFGQPC